MTTGVVRAVACAMAILPARVFAAIALDEGEGAALLGGACPDLRADRENRRVHRPKLSVHPCGQANWNDLGQFRLWPRGSVPIDFWIDFNHHPGVDPPSAGRRVLMVVMDRRYDFREERFVVGTDARFMPKPDLLPFKLINKLSDPAVAETFAAVRKLRKTEKPLTANEDYPLHLRETFAHAIVYGEVVKLERQSLRNGSADKLVLRPIRMLSCDFVTSPSGDIDATTDLHYLQSTFPALKAPAVGMRALVYLVQRRRASNFFPENFIPGAAFGKEPLMPADHAPICELSGEADPLIAQTFDAAARVFYWETHSLVYARLKQIAEPKGKDTTHALTLDPQLTLSGNFDAGKTSEVKVSRNSTSSAQLHPSGARRDDRCAAGASR